MAVLPVEYRILGQAAPAAETEVELYECNAIMAIVSALVIANISSDSNAYNIRVGFGAVDDKQFVAFEVPVDGHDSTTLQVPISLSNGDKIWVESSDGDLSFNAFGVEFN